MTRFKDIKVDTTAAMVEVGAGLTWDPVYAALESHGITVGGGRIPGVGVAGLTLGGGECLSSSCVPTGYQSQKASMFFLEEQTIRPHSRQYRRV